MIRRIAWVAPFALLLVVTSVVLGQSGFGIGWTAQYFNNTSLAGSPVYTETLPSGINFNWGTGSPNPLVPVDNFSARFTSVQLFEQGTYEFVISSDDGVRVYIDNVLVLDRFVGRVLTTDRFQQTLTAGSHSLTVEYVEFIDQAAIQFQWFQISGIPTPTVFGQAPAPILPTSTVTRIPPTPLPAIPQGALTGTIIRAQVLLVRGAPYLGAPVIGRVLRGQTYAVVGRDEDARWFLLQLSGTQGWVWGHYLFVNGNEFNAPIASPFVILGNPAAMTGVVGQTSDTLRLRAAPSVMSEQTGRIPWGDLLPIIARTGGGDWYKVVFRGTEGWVASQFVNIVEGDVNVVPVQ